MEQNHGFDLKRFLFVILGRWYFVVASLIIALSVAYIINRYTTKIYPVSMTILIKAETEKENNAANFLFKGQGLDFGKNYYNEELLIRSFPLSHEALKKLDFEISFYREGDIKTTEIFPKPPVFLRFDSLFDIQYGVNYKLTLLDGSEFLFYPEKNPNEQKLLVGEKTTYGFTLRHELKRESFPLEYLVRFNNIKSLAYAYSSRLAVNWIKQGASLLRLSINTSTPKKEITFLESLGRTYIEKDLTDKNESANRTISFINRELEIISDSLQNLEYRIELFKVNNLGTTVSEQSSRYLQQYDNLSNKISSFSLQKRYLDYLLEQIEDTDDPSELSVPIGVGITNQVLNSLVGDFIELQRKKSEFSGNSESINPLVKGLDSKIIQTKLAIKKSASRLKESLDIAIEKENEALTNAQKALLTLPEKERNFISLNRIYQLCEELYLILLEKKTEASITKASNVSDIEIVNPPAVSGGAIKPQAGRSYTMALLFGLAVPVLIIYVIERFNNKVNFKEDIQRITNVPILGVIGHSKESSDRLIDLNSKSAVSESFRMVRSNLNFFLRNETNGAKVLLITSSTSGEGKTFFSDNLAMLYAFSGNKVILVAGDMRRPNIFDDFNVKNSKGLSTYLAGESGLKEIIQTTNNKDLEIINSGPIPPNPSELLLRQRFQELIKSLRNEYDYVIVDSPPISLVSDALIISELVDHTVFITRQGYTRLDSLNNLNELNESKIKNLSIIFNDIRLSRYGYAYKYYGYGYGNSYYN